jgi:hypothetical protein
LTALVENVDNFMKNRRLGSVVETQCGKGKLILSSMDLLSDTEKRPAARQLLYSLITYMHSANFNPAGRVEPDTLEHHLKK